MNGKVSGQVIETHAPSHMPYPPLPLPQTRPTSHYMLLNVKMFARTCQVSLHPERAREARDPDLFVTVARGQQRVGGAVLRCVGGGGGGGAGGGEEEGQAGPHGASVPQQEGGAPLGVGGWVGVGKERGGGAGNVEAFLLLKTLPSLLSVAKHIHTHTRNTYLGSWSLAG